MQFNWQLVQTPPGVPPIVGYTESLRLKVVPSSSSQHTKGWKNCNFSIRKGQGPIAQQSEREGS